MNIYHSRDHNICLFVITLYTYIAKIVTISVHFWDALDSGYNRLISYFLTRIIL